MFVFELCVGVNGVMVMVLKLFYVGYTLLV